MASDKPKGAKPGVTGFVQDYNQEPGPRQDLNPDAVTDDSELPDPLPKTPKTPKTSGRARGSKSTVVEPMAIDVATPKRLERGSRARKAKQ